jgi:chromosome segregation ATPase
MATVKEIKDGILLELRTALFEWLSQWADNQKAQSELFRKEVREDIRCLEKSIDAKLENQNALIKEVNTLTARLSKLEAERSADHDLLIEIRTLVSEATKVNPTELKKDTDNAHSKIRVVNETLDDHEDRLRACEGGPGKRALEWVKVAGGAALGAAAGWMTGRL